MTGAPAEARCIYIMLSRTNTGIGRIIRLFLRTSRYNHVSAALDGRLFLLYSFSRARKDSPFSGGFVQEYPSRYLAMGQNVEVKVFRVPLCAQEYSTVLNKLSYCVRTGKKCFTIFLTPFFFRFTNATRLRTLIPAWPSALICSAWRMFPPLARWKNALRRI